MQESNNEQEPEITAISAVYAALRELDRDAQRRVLSWVAAKLKIDYQASEPVSRVEEYREHTDSHGGAEDEPEDLSGVLEGVSPVARKWITRSGLQPSRLSTIFSLGGEEVDLISNTVPGKSKKERMQSVFLLKGIASYLGTGAARFTHEQMKEACLHYDAFDAANFAVYFKSLSGQVSGSKDAGYTLTPRGIATATEIVKVMTQP